MPSDDILEGMYKLRIRESDQVKTVLELYDMEIHQKISMPNYQQKISELAIYPRHRATFGQMAEPHTLLQFMSPTISLK